MQSPPQVTKPDRMSSRVMPWLVSGVVGVALGLGAGWLIFAPTSANAEVAALIDDYLEANPTRNRILDMLPLFHYLDSDRVEQQVDDILVKPRPTLHYRLPNSEIDDPEWSLHRPWNDWMQVEALANDASRLDRWCYRYWLYLQQPMKWPFIDAWQKQVQKCLVDLS